MSHIKWRLDEAGGNVQWRLPSSPSLDLSQLVNACSTGGEDVTERRKDAALACCRQRHALRVALEDVRGAPARCIQLCVRRGSGRVNWESSLVAAQRAEGFIITHTRGRDDHAIVRVSPVSLQLLIATILSLCDKAGELCDPLPSLVARAQAERPLYTAAAEALHAQAARAAAGGEEWTHAERIQKLQRLTSMASAIAQRLEIASAEGPLDVSSISDVERSILEAYERGRSELYGPECEEENPTASSASTGTGATGSTGSGTGTDVGCSGTDVGCNATGTTTTGSVAGACAGTPASVVAVASSSTSSSSRSDGSGVGASSAPVVSHLVQAAYPHASHEQATSGCQHMHGGRCDATSSTSGGGGVASGEHALGAFGHAVTSTSTGEHKPLVKPATPIWQHLLQRGKLEAMAAAVGGSYE